MLDFSWDLTNSASENVGFAIANEVRQMVLQQVPDLKAHFAIFGRWKSECYANDILVVRIRFGSVPGIPLVGDLAPDHIRQARELTIPASYSEIKKNLGPRWVDDSTFTYVGPMQGGRACWSDVQGVLVAWVNAELLPHALTLNLNQLGRALPVPKPLDVRRVMSALWILESEPCSSQGTAFHLASVGLVTAEHVLAEGMVAFKADNVGARFPVHVVKKNTVLDLAIIAIESGALGESLAIGMPDALVQLSGVVVLGFPNYRLGDTGVLVAGQVVGFRQRSGVRRILTNAAIVAGTSGGPVLDADGRVIGVAVTGSDMFRTSEETEDHSIVPIDALNLM